MQLKTLIFGFLLSLFSVIAMAGSGHDHSHSHEPIDQNQAELTALKNLTRLVEKGKLDKSWASIKPSKIEKKTFSGHPEWVAVFTNDNITEPKKRTLYIFLSISGDYLAANYTGN